MPAGEGVVTVAVGDDGVVAVDRKERGPWLVQLCAEHYESVLVAVGGLAHPGLTVRRVVDRRPGVLGDLLDGPVNGWCLTHRDREVHVVISTRPHDVLTEEVRVAAQPSTLRTPRPCDSVPPSLSKRSAPH